MTSQLELRGNEKPTIEGLRAKNNAVGRKLLDEFWQNFRIEGEWPMARIVYSKHGTEAVRGALSSIGGNAVREEGRQSGRTVFQLTLVGLLLTTEGPTFLRLLLRYFEFQRELFQRQPEKLQIESREITATLNLSEEETEVLGHLIWLGGFYGGSGGRQKDTWTVSAMTEAERFPPTGDLFPDLQARVLACYDPNAQVFEEERRNSRNLNLSSSFVVEQPASHDQVFIPVGIQESLKEFRKDYPNAEKVCFIMMQFANTSAHAGIETAIKATLGKYGFVGVLARDKEYNDEMLPNIQTYLHGCGFGIAVFERIQQENFNPNVSLEVGYMMGHKKKVLLLKDQNLKLLQTDLVGRLYRPFDVLDPAGTIPSPIERWMEDKGLI